MKETNYKLEWKEEQARVQYRRIARRLRKERRQAEEQASGPCKAAVRAVWEEYEPRFEEAWQAHCAALAEIRKKYA